MYFSVKYEKNQEKPKLLEKNLEKTQGSQKKPKNLRLVRKTQDLGRKPKGWQRWWFLSLHALVHQQEATIKQKNK